MTLAARRRSIRKHVTQMAAAARAHLFHADHSIAAVAHPPDMRFIVGREETRPTRARVELGARAKQRQAAKAAGVDALLVIVEEHAAERRFSAVLEQHASRVLPHLTPAVARHQRKSLQTASWANLMRTARNQEYAFPQQEGTLRWTS